MELTKSDLQKLIQVQKENTFLNHFIFSLTKDYKTYGNIKKNKMNLWKSTGFTGSFYPVFSFEFDSEGTLIKITDELNPFAKFLRLLFPLFFFFPTLSTAFTDFQLKKFLICISIFLILSFASYLLSLKIYSYNKKGLLKDFYQVLNSTTKSKQLTKQSKSKILNNETEEKLEKEWTIGKILTRLFTYPFCFALILLVIFGMIPDGKFIIAIPMLVIIGVYLYSDLKMIFKSK
nr:hypothetical protein [Flavobacterium sp. ASV13]